MKNIVIIPNSNKDTDLKVTSRIVDTLKRYGAEVFIQSNYKEYISTSVAFYESFPFFSDLVIVVGGDGSVIDASIFAIDNDIPILGVNLGRLGYLSEVEIDNLDVLSKIFTSEYKIEEKMLLSVSHINGNVVTPSNRYAVNDIIISHDTFLGISVFRLENSGGNCVTYRGDGMILSTPVGSTAYSLSAGGPVVSHDVDSIVATPVCAHSFFNRSIIFKASENIKLENIGNTDLNISIDGRYFTNLSKGEKCVVTMAAKKLKMLTFSENNMFSTLFKKMRVLEDIK